MQNALLLAIAIQSIQPSTEFTEAELKRYFLVCDDNASQQMLDDADAHACSQIYEELKKRVFGGDSKALFEWWQSQREPPEKRPH